MLRELKNLFHLLEAFAAGLVYRFPSRSLIVIGVTGTDGKTTTSHLIYHILKSADKKVSLTSTVFTDIAGNVSDTGLHITTQSRWQIQKNIRKAVDNGSKYFVLETTSHGIDQYRVSGINFALGIITNVTHEHLDYHKTYEKYLATKTKLLLWSKKAIVNKDDESCSPIVTILNRHHKKYVTFSVKGDADYVWNPRIRTHLKEDFNRENIMAAVSCCRELGIPLRDILRGIRTFELPKGRFDCVYNEKFKVFIDFAHTPNSIRKLLSQFKSGKRKNVRKNIIHVFGSAGLRDAEKRPDMGRASGEFADIVILTEEDYRTESFDEIVKAVVSGLKKHGFKKHTGKGVPSKKTYLVIKNRQEAITKALKIAERGDIVFLTGKGHEQSLARGKKEYEWDEYRAVRKALILSK